MQRKSGLQILLISLIAVSCAGVTRLSTPTETNAPINALPLCEIVDGKLNILSDETLFALGPSEDEINQALEKHYPLWAAYQQNVPWSTQPVKIGEIVREASFQERFALNSEVTLVTLGEDFEWQLPKDNDIFAHSLFIAEHLVRLWDEFSHPDNQAIRSQYPQVSNGASYALYAFFNFDEEKLERWCNTYQKLFETSPMRK